MSELEREQYGSFEGGEYVNPAPDPFLDEAKQLFKLGDTAAIIAALLKRIAALEEAIRRGNLLT